MTITEKLVAYHHPEFMRRGVRAMKCNHPNRSKKTFRADNTEGLVPARNYRSLDEVPIGTGYNRVTVMETGEFWLRGSFADQTARWFYYPAAKRGEG